MRREVVVIVQRLSVDTAHWKDFVDAHDEVVVRGTVVESTTDHQQWRPVLGTRVRKRQVINAPATYPAAARLCLDGIPRIGNVINLHRLPSGHGLLCYCF